MTFNEVHGFKCITEFLSEKARNPEMGSWLATTMFETFGQEKADRLMAIEAMFTDNRAWEDIRLFEKVVLVLNGRMLFADIMQELDVKEISYAVHIMRETFPERMFNDEVSKYIAIMATKEGVLVLPPPIHFAQRFLPLIKLDKGQEQVAMAILHECTDYTDLMEGSES